MIAHSRHPTVVTDYIHYLGCIVNMQTIKAFIVPEVTFKSHSRSSARSSFIRSPERNQRPVNSATGDNLFSEKMTLNEGRLRSLAIAQLCAYHFVLVFLGLVQLDKSHTTSYQSAIVTALSCTIFKIFDVEEYRT